MKLEVIVLDLFTMYYRNKSFISHRLLITIRDFDVLDESRCKSTSFRQNSITKLLSCLFSYFLILSISQLVSLLSLYTGIELESKRI